MNQRFALVCCGLLGLSLLGCDSGPGTVSVSGKVTIDGEPAPEGVRVNFEPTGAEGETATGVVDASGNYTLYTGSQGHEGAMPGQYTVYLSPPPEGGEAYMSEPGSGSGVPGVPGPGPIPPEYISAQSSPEKVEVTSGDNTIDIEI